MTEKSVVAGGVFDLLNQHRNRPKPFSWKGVVSEFIEKLATDDRFKRLHVPAAQRVYMALMAGGAKKVSEAGTPRQKLFYAHKPDMMVYSTFEGVFFGIEETLHNLMEYHKGAALGGQNADQMYILHGAPSSGKSTLQKHIARSLETHEDGIFWALEGCPVHDDPLWILPRSDNIRERIGEMLGRNIDPERDICPLCQLRLKQEFDKDYLRFPVATYRYSQRNRMGIAVIPAQDPNDYNISKLTGTIDHANDEYPSNDPRVLILSGGVPVGNRGALRVDEVLKNPKEFLQVFHFVTQDHYCDLPGEHGIMWTDVMIMGNTNNSELKKFVSDDTNEGLKSRMIFGECDLQLHWDEEVQILERFVKQRSMQLWNTPRVPHTFRALALAGVASRLNPIKGKGKEDPGIPAVKHVRVLNGEHVVGGKHNQKLVYADVLQMGREAGPREEGKFGLQPRDLMLAFENSIGQRKFADPINALDALRRHIKENKERFSPEDSKEFSRILDEDVEPEVRKWLEKDIYRAYIHAFDSSADSLFFEIIENAEAYVMREEELPNKRPVDKKLLNAICEGLKIQAGSAEGFWQDVMNEYNRRMRKGEKVNRRTLTMLNEGIESYMMDKIREMARVITKAHGKRDPEEGKKYQSAISRFVDELGYPPESVDELLEYARKYILV